MKLGVPLVIGCVMIASLVVVQATAITAIVGLVRRQVPRGDARAHWVHSVGVFTRALLLIVAAQLVNFTTLGYGDIVMSRAWRLLGPLEAVAGMLMFGVSTAVLFGVTQALIRLGEGHGAR
jgi:hypothetical protein